MLKMVKLAIAPESSFPGSPASVLLKREGMSRLFVSGKLECTEFDMATYSSELARQRAPAFRRNVPSKWSRRLARCQCRPGQRCGRSPVVSKMCRLLLVAGLPFECHAGRKTCIPSNSIQMFQKDLKLESRSLLVDCKQLDPDIPRYR